MKSVLASSILIIGFACVCGVVSAFICTINKESVKNRIAGCILTSFITVVASYIVGFEDSGWRNLNYRLGMPIPIANSPDLMGEVIKPLYIDAESALVIGNDHKLYSLLGVQLEPSLSVTNMVGKDLIIYKKGNTVCIGIKEPEVKAAPTQIGYSTNK